MTKNTRIIVGLVLSTAAIVILMFTSMPQAGSKEITIADIVNNPASYEGDYIMTQGLLNEDSIDWDADNIELRFQLYDEKDVSLPVFYQGIKPDNFSKDVIVMVEGFLNHEGIFEAERVTTKCPSKYEGVDIENYDVDMHKEILKDTQE